MEYGLYSYDVQVVLLWSMRCTLAQSTKVMARLGVLYFATEYKTDAACINTVLRRRVQASTLRTVNMQPIKGNSKVVSIRRESVQLDHQTGEVTKEASTNVFRLPAEPPYVKLYAHDLTQILKLKDHHAVMILELVRKMDYDNLISLTPSARSRIAEKLGVKDQTFRNYLNELVKADVIRRVGHNEFEANPTLFARGDWAAIYERQRAFTMTVSYTQKGRTVQTEISQDDNSAEA